MSPLRCWMKGDPLAFSARHAAGNWHLVEAPREPGLCSCGPSPSHGVPRGLGGRRGGARREALCARLPCKLPGVPQGCFLYAPEMFMRLFSLAGDRPLQLSGQAEEGGFLAGGLFTSPGRKNEVFSMKLTSPPAQGPVGRAGEIKLFPVLLEKFSSNRFHKRLSGSPDAGARAVDALCLGFLGRKGSSAGSTLSQPRGCTEPTRGRASLPGTFSVWGGGAQFSGESVGRLQRSILPSTPKLH